MRLCWIAFVALATVGGADARFASAAEPEMHYAPVENLEHIDLALIRSATKSLDMAMYTLTDWAINRPFCDGRHSNGCRTTGRWATCGGSWGNELGLGGASRRGFSSRKPPVPNLALSVCSLCVALYPKQKKPRLFGWV
jgi:hypothetical protein